MMNENKYGIDQRVWNTVGVESLQGLAGLQALMLASVTSVEHLSEMSSVKCPEGLVDAERLGVESSVSPQVLRSILKTWVMTHGDETQASYDETYATRYKNLVEILGKWDHKLAVWCALACVQQAMALVKSQPPRFALSMDAPAHTLELTRQWVLGECPDDDLAMAGKVLMRDVTSDVDYVSVPCGVLATGAGFYDPVSVNRAVAYAAETFADIDYGEYLPLKQAWEDHKTRAWVGFLPTIAEAIDTFPLHYDGMESKKTPRKLPGAFKK